MTGKLKLDDRRWRAVMASVKDLGRQFVKVGVLADSDEEVAVGFTLVDLAKAHEYGVPGRLAERSFLRATLDAHRPEIVAFQRKLVGLVLTGKLTEERALDLLGAMVAGLVKKFIMSGRVQPDIAESTKARKGSDVVLLDNGILVNHITHSVVTA